MRGQLQWVETFVNPINLIGIHILALPGLPVFLFQLAGMKNKTQAIDRVELTYKRCASKVHTKFHYWVSNVQDLTLEFSTLIYISIISHDLINLAFITRPCILRSQSVKWNLKVGFETFPNSFFFPSLERLSARLCGLIAAFLGITWRSHQHNV